MLKEFIETLDADMQPVRELREEVTTAIRVIAEKDAELKLAHKWISVLNLEMLKSAELFWKCQFEMPNPDMNELMKQQMKVLMKLNRTLKPILVKSGTKKI